MLLTNYILSNLEERISVCRGAIYRKFCVLPPRLLRVVLPEKLGGGVQPASQTLSLFMTTIGYIPCYIYDLTKNSKPYLWPEPYINILFQTYVIISFPLQTNVKLPLT